MTTNELNEYIKRYLQEDRTHSAVMLTAPWGTGKSHYIKTGLIPFLEDEKIGYALISLYGLKDLSEISKSLYLELRLNKPFRKTKKKKRVPKNRFSKWFFNHGKEVAHSVVGVGKTIVKSVASIFNIDINFSDKDLQKIFESVNLTNKLIILEDLERSPIDIIEVLGYVNNLVEQDGVKVLLVANEEEILRIEEQKPKTNDSINRILDKQNAQQDNKVELPKNARSYLRVKEKTISDTIYFETPLVNSLTQIMQSFECKYFNDLLKEIDDNGNPSIVSEILEIWREEETKINLRSFIFACQKTKDILTSTNGVRDLGFAKSIFIDNIRFAIKFKSVDNIHWQDITYGMSIMKYRCPIFYVNYAYIFNHVIDNNQIEKEEKEFLHNRKIHDEHVKHDNDFQILRSFYYREEKEIVETINRIRNRLQTTNEIPLISFGELANYLIAVKPCIQSINVDDIIDDCKTLMIEKLRATDSDVSIHIQHHNGMVLWEDSQKEEYEKFTKMALEANEERKKRDLAFDYSLENLSEFSKTLYTYQTAMPSYEKALVRLDVDKMINLLKNSTARQIDEIRGIYREIYRNIRNFSDQEKEEIIATRNRIATELSQYHGYDGIQKLQIYWILNDFNKIIETF